MNIFDEFPYLEGERIIIHKMEEKDLNELKLITNNDHVYRFIPPFLYKKSDHNLLLAIQNIPGRDFEKKKWIIPGVYLKTNPEKLIGFAEMFDYKKRTNTMTIGYRFNETYWHQGYAKETISLLINYLIQNCQLNGLFAYVMPENIYSSKALLHHGFIATGKQQQEKNWGGNPIVLVDEYRYNR